MVDHQRAVPAAADVELDAVGAQAPGVRGRPRGCSPVPHAMRPGAPRCRPWRDAPELLWSLASASGRTLPSRQRSFVGAKHLPLEVAAPAVLSTPDGGPVWPRNHHVAISPGGLPVALTWSRTFDWDTDDWRVKPSAERRPRPVLPGRAPPAWRSTRSSGQGRVPGVRGAAAVPRVRPGDEPGVGRVGGDLRGGAPQAPQAVAGRRQRRSAEPSLTGLARPTYRRLRSTEAGVGSASDAAGT